jgi:shikimate kinase
MRRACTGSIHRRGRPRGNLYLVGFRCTGKTSIGRALSRRLRKPFVDADEQVIAAAAMAISDIVDSDGWAGFRRRERRVMMDVCRAGGQVVATGGGAVLDAATRRDMRASGIVVWLTASAPTIAARMAADPATPSQRPALDATAPPDDIAQTLAARTPLYAQTAHLRVVTDNRSIPGICDEIIVRMTSFFAARHRAAAPF